MAEDRDEMPEPKERDVHTVPADRDLVGEGEAPEDVEQINPLEGLMTPEDDEGGPASESDAPAPFG